MDKDKIIALQKECIEKHGKIIRALEQEIALLKRELEENKTIQI